MPGFQLGSWLIVSPLYMFMKENLCIDHWDVGQLLFLSATLAKFWDCWARHFFYLHSEMWNPKFIFSVQFCHSYINRFLWFAFYPIGFPWSTRREGWSRRKGRKGDLCTPACACLIFLMLSALLFSLCKSLIHLIFLLPVLQKHTDAWSKKSGLQRGTKAWPLETRVLSNIEENYNPQIARLQFFWH